MNNTSSNIEEELNSNGNNNSNMDGGRRRTRRKSHTRKMRGGQNVLNNGNANNDNANNDNANNDNANNDNMEGGAVPRRRKSNNNNNNNNNNQDGGARAKIPAVGSHAQVWHGTAKHTSGGLTKKDLMKNKRGKIISRKKHALGKKALKHLVKAGYKTVKGKFSTFKKK